MHSQSFNLKEVFNSLSTALDFTYSGMSRHHKRVAYMAVTLAKRLRLPGDTVRNLYMSSIIHDIGAISMLEKKLLGELEVKDPYTHSEMGCRMVKSIKFLKPVSSIIRSHHDSWKGGNPSGLSGSGIPLESRIINAVDRLDVLIDHSRYILEQTDGVLKRLGEIAGKIIDPDIFAELVDMAGSESFWLDLHSDFLPDMLCGQMADSDIYLDSEMLTDISLLFSKVIDQKSAFTSRHSRLVAASSGMLARISGFTPQDTEKMVVAGLLHDIGKLSIPEEILLKPGKLSPGEFLVIKRHSYYTHRILEGISGFTDINRWASYHHEKLDGTGYPFKLSAENIPQGSRIMAVSDVFAALAEDRPYRKGMPREMTAGILSDMAGSVLDREAVGLLLDYYYDPRYAHAGEQYEREPIRYSVSSIYDAVETV
ncbi:MAG: HD domain-containing protein [Peptococcaceae bacterium]|nr:HD domain-containing protein [Peptococcaceae bacterium]